MVDSPATEVGPDDSYVREVGPDGCYVMVKRRQYGGPDGCWSTVREDRVSEDRNWTSEKKRRVRKKKGGNPASPTTATILQLLRRTLKGPQLAGVLTLSVPSPVLPPLVLGVGGVYLMMP